MVRKQFHRLEYPSGLGYSKTGPSLRDINVMFQQPPTDELVALMTAAPLADDDIPKEPYGPLFDIAEEILTEDEFAVIQMLFGGNISQREAGLLLARQKGRATAYSKTWVRKLRNRALQKLRNYATLRHASPHDFGDSE